MCPRRGSWSVAGGDGGDVSVGFVSVRGSRRKKKREKRMVSS